MGVKALIYCPRTNSPRSPHPGPHTQIPTPTLPQVKPIEEAFKFSHFFSPFLTESDFDAKPSILLLGQYSTGKVRIPYRRALLNLPPLQSGPPSTKLQPPAPPPI